MSWKSRLERLEKEVRELAESKEAANQVYFVHAIHVRHDSEGRQPGVYPDPVPPGCMGREWVYDGDSGPPFEEIRRRFPSKWLRIVWGEMTDE